MEAAGGGAETQTLFVFVVIFQLISSAKGTANTMTGGGTAFFGAPIATTMKASQQKEDIVEKLHGALANLRRERDDEHRKKELAMERLRLAMEEREAMDKTVKSMKAELGNLLKKSEQEAKNDIAKLQNDVERLNREVKFQHTELLGKRDKVARLSASMEQDHKKMESSLSSMRDTVHQRREKAPIQIQDVSEAEQMDKIVKLLQEVDAADLWRKWPKLVEQKATAVTMEAGDLHRTCETLRRRISGYSKHLYGEHREGVPADPADVSALGEGAPSVVKF